MHHGHILRDAQLAVLTNLDGEGVVRARVVRVLAVNHIVVEKLTREYQANILKAVRAFYEK